MGIEFLIKFKHSDGKEIDRLLRQAPYFFGFVDAYNLYEYRSDPDASLSGLPDATASIEPEGIYFCDYCSQKAKDVFDYLYRQAQRLADRVVIEEL